MPLLRFDAVHKQYPGGRAALQDVSFGVEAGEVLFVTGHSGAGKSTLLKLLHLAERPDRGAVLLEDRNLAAVRGVEAAKSWRNQVAAEMLPSQIAEAQKLAREWLNIFK